MTRPCSGCGGTGRVYPQKHIACYNKRWSWPGIPAYMKPARPKGTPCGACQGSGQVEDDSTSDRDALVDAETLRANTRNLPTAFTPIARDFDFGVYRKAMFSCGLRGSIYGWLIHATEHYLEARLAARAAFRAVPGLRGE